MKDEERDTHPVRLRKSAIKKIEEYVRIAGSSVSHVASDALDKWAERDMPDLLKRLKS